MSQNPLKMSADNGTDANAPEAIIDKFLDTIWMERGLSVNTLGAYRADLMALQRWLAKRDISLIYATRADLLAFIDNPDDLSLFDYRDPMIFRRIRAGDSK